jgi:hypothetical protein
MVILLEESQALTHFVVLCYSYQLPFLLVAKIVEERVLCYKVERSTDEEQGGRKSGNKVRSVRF